MSAFHLTEEQIQGLADGTLRGPEGFAAREHADGCDECSGELAMYAALVDRLSTLSDPPVPDDFTVEVMDAVDHRERALQQRRHTVLAAIPAGLIGLFAIFGWALSSAPTVHVDRFIEAWTLARHVVAAAAPVLDATRLPLGLGALVFSVAIAALLLRAMRGSSAPTPASP